MAQRYTYITWVDENERPMIDFEASATGDFVRHNDHVAELATLRAEVARLRDAMVDMAMTLNKTADYQVSELMAENERLREALEPSGDTKAAYMGEIRDPDTKRDVSWSAIKMIMKMISDRADKEALK